jgi:hypothetical protein
MPVTSPPHFHRLLTVPKIQLTYTPAKTERLGMIPVSPILAQQRADYAVQFRVFTKQMLPIQLAHWNTPNTHHNYTFYKLRKT